MTFPFENVTSVWYLNPDRVTLHVLHRQRGNMSRQTTLGRFGFEKSISQKNSVMETKVLDFFFNYVKGN